MAGFTVEVSVAVVAAVFIAEIVSAVWYSGPWGRYGTRYFLSGVICDVGLVVLLKTIILKHWPVRSWEDAALLAMWLSLMHACLEAPHHVKDHHSLSHYFFHVSHKFVLVFAICMALHVFEKVSL